MRPSDLKYRRAASLSDVPGLLASPGGATVMGGGQALLRDLRARTLSVGTLVDISRIPELDYVRFNDDVLEIGAVTTLATVASDARVQRRCSALANAAGRVADVQIRHRATVAGNICGSWTPTKWSTDVGVVLAACGGDVVVLGPEGQRLVPGAEFVESVANPLGPAEFITAVRIPMWPGSGYERLSRGWAGASIGSAAAFVSSDGGVMRVGLAIGQVHNRIAALEMVAHAIESDGLNAPSVDSAIAETAARFTILDSVHADAEYRRSILSVLVRRSVTAALANGGIQ